MKTICIYFQIHHPFSFRTFRFFDIGKSKPYYDDFRIEKEINEVVENYYLPLNDFLLKLIQQSNGKLKLSFYISGTTLDQFLIYAPKMLNSFRQLADSGQVEFLGGTSSHSIVSIGKDEEEFRNQIRQNRERIEFYFGQKPKLFVNTDLMFTTEIGKIVAEIGYPALLTNGSKRILQWRSPNFVYSADAQHKINILFRNEIVSEEFTSIIRNPGVSGKAESIKQLFSGLNFNRNDEPLVNIYLNYRTLGGQGMTDKQRFFRSFVSKVIRNQSITFSLPSELLESIGAVAEIGTNDPICWYEHFHSLYYPGNLLQEDAIHQLFKLKKQVQFIENSKIKTDWRYLQTSDHFHLMDDNHPAYLGDESITAIYKSKYDAYINYMNILEDFRQRLKEKKIGKKFKGAIDKPVHPNPSTMPIQRHVPIYK